MFMAVLIVVAQAGAGAPAETAAEARSSLSAVADIFTVVVWPLAILVVLALFRKPLSAVISRSQQIQVTWAGGGGVILTANEATNALTDVFAEIDTILNDHLKDEEKDLFLRILRERKTPAVIDVLPNFKRGTDEHFRLRALRGAYFIRPVRGGTWQANSRIEVTTLGRLVAKHKRDALNARTAPAAPDRSTK